MHFLKDFLVNFLVIFFVNHVVSGIDIAYYSKLPHIEGDIIFAFGLGLLSTLIFPVMRLFQLKPSHFKIGIVSFCLSFFAYSIVNILPLGIKVHSAGGFIWGGLIVWFSSFLTNYMEYKRYIKAMEEKIPKD